MPEGYYKQGKPRKPKPAPRKPAPRIHTEAEPRPTYSGRRRYKTTPAPMPEPHVPASQPISERAMASKARTARITRSRKHTYEARRVAAIEAARYATFVPPGLHHPARHPLPLSPGQLFNAQMHMPLMGPGGRVLATRGERRMLASAASAKRQRLADLSRVRIFPSTHPYQPSTAGVRGTLSERAASYARTHGHVGGGAYSRRTIRQLSRSPEGRAHLLARHNALLAAQQELNPGDVSSKEAKRVQVELGKVEAAGIGIGTGLPVKVAQDLIDATLGTPYGLYLLGRHPVGTSKALINQYGQMIQHPGRYWHEHPGLFLVNAGAAAAGGLGAVAKVGAGASALRLSAADLAEAGVSRGTATRLAAWHGGHEIMPDGSIRYGPPLRTLRHDGQELKVAPSRNAAVRAMYGARGLFGRDNVTHMEMHMAQKTAERIDEHFLSGREAHRAGVEGTIKPPRDESPFPVPPEPKPPPATPRGLRGKALHDWHQNHDLEMERYRIKKAAYDRALTKHDRYEKAILDAASAQGLGKAWTAGKRFAKSLHAGEHSKATNILDTYNQATVSAMLYLSLKYPIVNTVGQLWLGLTNGSLNPFNLAAAYRMHGEIFGRDPKLLKSLRKPVEAQAEELGAGAFQALGGGLAKSVAFRGKTNPILRGSSWISEQYGKIIDDPYRWASFVRHARSRGFRSSEDVIRLLKGEDRHGKFSQDVADERRVAFEEANRDMIDYERLSQAEKNIVRRLVLFYPWVKGSTYFYGRWLREHPIQASAQLQLGVYANRKRQGILGDVPQWASQLIPIGTENVPGLGRVPIAVDPASGMIVPQTAEVAGALLNTIQHKGGFSLGEFAGPAFTAGAAALGWDISKGEKLRGSVGGLLLGSIPAVHAGVVAERNITGGEKGRIGYTVKRKGRKPEHRHFVYPRSTFEQMMRTFGLGGLMYSPVNLQALHHSARLQGVKKGKHRGGGGGSSDWFPSKSGGGGGGSGDEWFPAK